MQYHRKLTLAHSIFSVQQPEYMSAPFKDALALWADWMELNVRFVKKKTTEFLINTP